MVPEVRVVHSQEVLGQTSRDEEDTVVGPGAEGTLTWARACGCREQGAHRDEDCWLGGREPCRSGH